MFIYLGYWDNAYMNANKPGITTRKLGHRYIDHQHPCPGFEYYFVIELIGCRVDQLPDIERKVLNETIEFAHVGYERYEIRMGGIEIREAIKSAMIKTVDENNVQYSVVDPSRYTEMNENDPPDTFPPGIYQPFPIIEYRHRTVLKGFQVELYNLIKSSHADRCNFEVFCGGGKTHIYQKLFEDNCHIYDCFLLIVPSISLMSDMKKRWEPMIIERKWECLYVCSETYATTNIRMINRAIYNSGKLFIFTTIQSFEKCEKAFAKYRRMYIIGDEAHHLCDITGEKKYSPIKWIHDRKYKPKMLFATATPIVGDYKMVESDSLVMNNRRYFGRSINLNPSANLKRLLAEGFLCQYEVLMGAVNVNDIQIAKNIKKNNRDQYLNYVASCKLICKLIEFNSKKYKKILMYTNGIGGDSRNNIGVRNLTELIKKAIGKISNVRIGVYSADSCATHEQNKQAIIGFEDLDNKHDVNVLVNCRMYSEGINIPSLDTVVFCDPKQSISEIVQIFGRPLRIDINNPAKKANIVIPYLSNLEYSNTNQYSKILNIIKVVSTQDEYLRDEIKLGVAKKRGKRIRTLVICSGDKKISNSDFRVDVRIFDFLNKAINKICGALEDAVLYVLGDHVSRMAYQIEQIITENKMFACEVGSCEVECDRLLAEGKIKKLVAQGDVYYYIEQKAVMSTREFIESLRLRGIDSEIKYHESMAGYYTDENPIAPLRVYSNFDWSMMAKNECYALGECIEVVKRLEGKVIEIIGREFRSDEDKNKILCDMDDRIPHNMGVYYGVRLTDINVKIFRIIERNW